MRVDPTARQASPVTDAPPERDAPPPADGEHWSPLSTSRARWAWGLMALFSAIYFAVAILTSAEFAELAATEVLGLPLGFILGVLMIIAGLVITRVYLAKVEG